MNQGAYKIPTFLLSLILLTGLVSACGSNESKEAPESQTTSLKTTLDENKAQLGQSIKDSGDHIAPTNISLDAAPTVYYKLHKLDQSAVLDFLKIQSSDLESDEQSSEEIKNKKDASFALEMTPYSVTYMADIKNRLSDLYLSHTGSRALYDASQFPMVDLDFKSRQDVITECQEILEKIGAAHYRVSDIVTIDKSAVDKISSQLNDPSLLETFKRDDEGYNLSLEQVVADIDIPVYQGDRFFDRQRVLDPKSRCSIAYTRNGIYSIELDHPLDFTVDTSNTHKLLTEDAVRKIILDYENTLLDGHEIQIKSLHLNLQLPLQSFGQEIPERGALQYVWILKTFQVTNDEKGQIESNIEVVIDAQTGEILYGL